LVVPWLASKWGWPASFMVMGGLGFIWAGGWLWLYREPGKHRGVSPAELAYIRKDPPDPPAKIPWRVLLNHRQTWAFAAGMTTSAPIWWFYIFWAPDFLNKRFNLGLTQSSLPLIVMFLVAGVGGVAGGWLPAMLLRRGWTVNAARKTAMLICALCVVPVLATPLVPNPWVAISLVALAAAAHCGYAPNLFTMVSDTVPKQAVGSVVGIGGMVGALGGMVFAQLVSRVLEFTHNNYVVPFAISSMAYLVGLGIIHLLLPRLEQMQLEPGVESASA
jgi:ACS family hexuronate transporter-like MFS transporter